MSLARLGILPFFWIASAVLFLWARRHFGNIVACFAVGLFTFLPVVLAHSGLATTDMALTAFVAAGLLTFVFCQHRLRCAAPHTFGSTGHLSASWLLVGSAGF